MSKEPQVEGTVSITPIKQQQGKRIHAESSTDKQFDAYKVWLKNEIGRPRNRYTQIFA
jgi:hypothetical protein